MQRTGQGVDIIFHDMLSMGKPFPEYQVFNGAVKLTLKSTNEVPDFVRFIVKEQERMAKQLTLAELMVIRYLYDDKKIKLHKICELTQLSDAEAKKCCMDLIKMGLIETAGREYMLTARVYHAIKSDVAYVQDSTINYIKAKGRILEYLDKHDTITNEQIRELCNVNRTQTTYILQKMKNEKCIELIGKGRSAHYRRT